MLISIKNRNHFK